MSLTGERLETRRERKRKELPANRKATENVCVWILTLVLFMRCLCESVIFQNKSSVNNNRTYLGFVRFVL